jgi:hypothetical protein
MLRQPWRAIQPLSTGQKFERLKKVSLIVFKIKEYMTQVIEAITKNALGFAPVLFNFDWFLLMKPFTSATCPTQSNSKQGKQTAETFRINQMSVF